MLSTLDLVWDDSAVELMAAFYQGLLEQDHLSYADALREAVLAVKARPEFENPRHWAPFVVYR